MPVIPVCLQFIEWVLTNDFSFGGLKYSFPDVHPGTFVSTHVFMIVFVSRGNTCKIGYSFDPYFIDLEDTLYINLLIHV